MYIDNYRLIDLPLLSTIAGASVARAKLSGRLRAVYANERAEHELVTV